MTQRALRASIFAVAFLSLGSGSARAQLVPPAPPKPAPTPTWEPPPPPEPPPAPPPVPVVEPPPITLRGPDGKVVWLTVPPEVAALEKMGVPDDKRALYQAVRAERSVLAQRRLAERGDAALRARAALSKVLADPNYAAAMDALPLLRELMLPTSLSRQLEWAGVLEPAQSLAVEKAVRHYSSELSRDLKAEIEREAMSVQMQRTASLNLRKMAVELAPDLEALLSRTGQRWDAITADLALSPTDPSPFGEALVKVQAAADPRSRADAVAQALSYLPADQVRAVLAAGAPPLPEPRVIPEAPPTPPRTPKVPVRLPIPTAPK